MRPLASLPELNTSEAARADAPAESGFTPSLAPNVVRFPGARVAGFARRDPRTDQKSLLDTIYTNGALVIAADDAETKTMAARLQVFGFLNIAEVSMDGSTRRLRASETMDISLARPWRLSRPSWDAAAQPG